MKDLKSKCNLGAHEKWINCLLMIIIIIKDMSSSPFTRHTSNHCTNSKSTVGKMNQTSKEKFR